MEGKAEEVPHPEKMEALTSTLLGTDIGERSARGRRQPLTGFAAGNGDPVTFVLGGEPVYETPFMAM